LEKYGTGLAYDQKERYWYWASLMAEEDANHLLNFQVQLNDLKVRKHEILKYLINVQSISDVLYTDMQLVLVSDMLHKVDSMSMANSLEVRVPFLDYNLVNFVFTLPDSYKINGKMRKRILQDAYRDILPPELYQRPKQGFEVPLMDWFKTELNDELMNTYLNPDYLVSQKIFNPVAIAQLKNQLYAKNPGDIQAHLWALLVFQHWWMKYMD
jgi:asparagine synthase (glutamine-hydrolysing)